MSGAQALGRLLLLYFQVHWQGTGSELEEPELELLLIWHFDIAGRGLSHCSIVLAPLDIFTMVRHVLECLHWDRGFLYQYKVVVLVYVKIALIFLLSTTHHGQYFSSKPITHTV